MSQRENVKSSASYAWIEFKGIFKGLRKVCAKYGTKNKMNKVVQSPNNGTNHQNEWIIDNSY